MAKPYYITPEGGYMTMAERKLASDKKWLMNTFVGTVTGTFQSKIRRELGDFYYYYVPVPGEDFFIPPLTPQGSFDWRAIYMSYRNLGFQLSDRLYENVARFILWRDQVIKKLSPNVDSWLQSLPPDSSPSLASLSPTNSPFRPFLNEYIRETKNIKEQERQRYKTDKPTALFPEEIKEQEAKKAEEERQKKLAEEEAKKIELAKQREADLVKEATTKVATTVGATVTGEAISKLTEGLTKTPEIAPTKLSEPPVSEIDTKSNIRPENLSGLSSIPESSVPPTNIPGNSEEITDIQTSDENVGVTPPSPTSEEQSPTTGDSDKKEGEEEEEEEEEQEEEPELQKFEPKPIPPITSAAINDILKKIFDAMEDHGFKLELKIGDKTITPTKDMLTIVVNELIKGLETYTILDLSSIVTTPIPPNGTGTLVGVGKIKIP